MNGFRECPTNVHQQQQRKKEGICRCILGAVVTSQFDHRREFRTNPALPHKTTGHARRRKAAGPAGTYSRLAGSFSFKLQLPGSPIEEAFFARSRRAACRWTRNARRPRSERRASFSVTSDIPDARHCRAETSCGMARVAIREGAPRRARAA